MSDLPSINPLSVPDLGMALDGAVRAKRKAPSIKSYAARLTRVAKKAPEVVVKVSGSGKKPGQILAHMSNIPVIQHGAQNFGFVIEKGLLRLTERRFGVIQQLAPVRVASQIFSRTWFRSRSGVA